MFQYLIKRVLLFVPTFFIISVLVFILSRVVPGDPVAANLSEHSAEGTLSAEMVASEEAYLRLSQKMGLDKPIFYFSLQTAAYPDTLYRISPARQRDMLRGLTRYVGNWPKVVAYYNELKSFRADLTRLIQPKRLSAKTRTTFRTIAANISRLLTLPTHNDIKPRLDSLQAAMQSPGLQVLQPSFKKVSASFEQMMANRKPLAHLIPKIHWYGWDNQYHNWMTGFFQGDFGQSYTTDYPVEKLIGSRLYWTLILNLISLVIVFGLSIPLGVYSAIWHQEGTQHFNIISWLPAKQVGIAGGLRFVFAQLLRFLVLSFFILSILGIFWLLPLSIKLGLGLLGLAYMLQIYMLPIFLPKDSRARRFIGRWAWLAVMAVLFLLPPLVSLALIGGACGLWIGQGKRANHKGSLRLTKRGLSLKGSYIDNLFTLLVFLLYSLPSFWIGTLLVVYTTTSGGIVDWFPTQGVMSIDIAADASWWYRFQDVAAHLTLPVFCLTYGALAVISRQMRRGMLDVIQSDYILTARAKGVSKHKVIWKHTFRNALMPILALSAGILPGMLAGSVAIENIFNIPGMGMLVLASINSGDWPVVLTILMFAAILTIMSSLLADILTKWLNPRVNFK